MKHKTTALSLLMGLGILTTQLSAQGAFVSEEGFENLSPAPDGELEETNQQAMDNLNERRKHHGLGEVEPESHLAQRCADWLKAMAPSGMHHDPKVYGTNERENLAGAFGYPITVEESMRMWDGSPPHAASMYDRGFPTAHYGGYAQVQGYACLRLCPKMNEQGPCSQRVFSMNP